jgi:LCP family protein required for cell wall assembly
MADTHEDVLPMHEDDSPSASPRRRKSHRTLLIALGLLLAVLAVAVAGAAWVGQSVFGELGTIEDPFEALVEADRPAIVESEVTEPGTTFLLAGTDRRSEVPTTGSQAEAPSWIYGAQRSDTIMLVHLTGDGERAYVVSIPRDSWIDIPRRGQDKANAAFSYGGPSLFVETIEDLTDVRVDHVAVVDWSGLVGLVDALGGVELTFSTETVGRGSTWPPGTHTLSGEEVLDYVGERYRLPNGEFGRIQRQQAVLRSIAEGLISQDVLASPATALATARAVTRSLSVDETLGLKDIVQLALKGKDLRPSDVTYVTVPNKGSGQVGDQSVVFLKTDQLEGFFTALKKGELERWIEKNGASVTGKTIS